MTAVGIREKLVVKDKAAYGASYEAHCLEIYKLYVTMADNISVRRQSANSFFLAVNTAIIGVVGYVGGTSGNWNWAVSLAGLILCYAWYRLIRSYKDINSGKFKVIHEIEKELPLLPYDAEWEALGRGKDPSLYLPFTHIEIWVPGIFGALHAIVLFLSIPWDPLLSSLSQN